MRYFASWEATLEGEAAFVRAVGESQFDGDGLTGALLETIRLDIADKVLAERPDLRAQSKPLKVRFVFLCKLDEEKSTMNPVVKYTGSKTQDGKRYMIEFSRLIDGGPNLSLEATPVRLAGEDHLALLEDLVRDAECGRLARLEGD